MVMQDLRATLIQSKLHWENPTANLAMFEEKIWQIGQPTDVIVLPEMFTTGFSMRAGALAEMMNLQTTRWMKQMAAQTGALIVGSFITNDNGKYFNRLLWTEPGGVLKTYDKRHLFRMASEQTVYSSGEHRLIANWKGWSICPMVCYDLRFPVWSRNTWVPDQERMSYDLLVYVASWPQARILAWDTLLPARAIENLAYTAGLNRVGPDGNGVDYNGHSAVFGPKGERLYAAGEAEETKTIALDWQQLQDHRSKFPAYMDADDFRIQ